MPELPEVETIKQDLENVLIGKTIERIRVLDDRVIRNIKASRFIRELRNRKISSVSRRGKALVFAFSDFDQELVVQLMMTGQMIVSSSSESQNVTKVIFTLSNDIYLLYNDVRLFGRLQLVRDLQELKYFRLLGPEPLSSSWQADSLQSRTNGSRRTIKAALMDHSIVAGIGNIYASEILFDSRIRPQRPAGSLSAGQLKQICLSAKRILRAAIRSRGTSMNTYRDSAGKKGRYMQKIQVYGRAGEPCLSCQQQINKINIAGRSSFYCPHCQE